MAITKLSRQIGNQTNDARDGQLLAPQSQGAVVVTYGETQVLCTTNSAKPREGSTSSR